MKGWKNLGKKSYNKKIYRIYNIVNEFMINIINIQVKILILMYMQNKENKWNFFCSKFEDLQKCAAMIGPSLKLPLCFNFSEEFQMHTFHTVFFSISLVPPNRSNVHSFTQMKTLMNFKCNRLLKFLNFTVSGWNLFMQKMLVNLRSLFKSLRYLKIETIHVFVCLTYIMKVNRNS